MSIATYRFKVIEEECKAFEWRGREGVGGVKTLAACPLLLRPSPNGS